MKPVRLVVFDLDGTLVDSVADIASAVNRMLAQKVPGASPLPLATVRSFVGNGARALVSRVLARAGAEVSMDEALAAFLDAYRAGLLDATRPYPGVVEGLDLMRDRTLAVLTNKPGDMSRAILEGLGVASRFARVYGGGGRRRREEPTTLPSPFLRVGKVEGNGSRPRGLGAEEDVGGLQRTAISRSRELRVDAEGPEAEAELPGLARAWRQA